MAGAAHNVGTGIGEGFMDGFIRNMAHDVGHNGFQLADGAALALKITAAVLVHQAVIFAVVVPHRAGAVFQDIFPEHFLPVSPGGRLGKVREHAFSAPPGSDARLIAVAGLHKHAPGLHFVQLGMDEKDARFYVGGYGYAPFIHLGKEFHGIFEPLFVPGKDAALDTLIRLHGAVAGGKLETVNRYLLFLCGVDEIQNSVVAVLIQFRIIHGGTQISKGIPGKHGGFACEVRIALHDLTHGRACNEEEIDVAAVCAVTAVGLPVVALLTAHVKIALVGIVVEIPHCLFCAAV